MVLSNKKLKQKLRTEISESAAKTSISNSTDSNSANPETLQSLKQLLRSAAQKPILSKREKRRETLSLQSPEVGNGEKPENGIDHFGETENGRKKKRKRETKEKGDENNGGVDGELDEKEEGGDLNKGGKASKKNKEKAKKKKEKKKKKKNRKNGMQEKQFEGEHGAVSEQTVAGNNSLDNAGDNRKVYVGGIPYYSTEDDIRSYFDHCGTITDVDCMAFPDSGKFRGIAIIGFKTEEAAKRALALDGSDMGGLYLLIKPYKATQTAKTTTDFSPPVLAGYNRIYAGNLSWDVTENDLSKFFTNCNISAIRFGEDKETGEFKGYAHVDFTDDASLTKALKLDQMVLCGRPVRIRCAVPLKKGTVTNSGSVLTVVQPDTMDDKAETQNNSRVRTGKLKRRTCYECGERGHISSACPKSNPLNK